VTEQEENELICKKLLGWKFESQIDDGSDYWSDGTYNYFFTPSFETWYFAGKILDALQASRDALVISQLQYKLGFGKLNPEEIRKAALLEIQYRKDIEEEEL
jgi:hypothetical protein